MQAKIPAVIMRGGTSRGVFFHERHLPEPGRQRDDVILAAFGSPDPYGRQIDGLGGATSTTSKVVMISPSSVPGCDVDYFFGQVDVRRPLVDYSGTCGNLSAAVGPFAIEEGLAAATDPLSVVNIWQVNTRKRIRAHIPTKEGQPLVDGDFFIDGIPSPGGRIILEYLDPGGSCTSGLLPTGNVRDTIEVPGLGAVEATLIDATNPVALVRAADLGLAGTELAADVDDNARLKGFLEAVRAQASVLMGLAASPEEATLKRPGTPKVGFVSPPQSYVTYSGATVEADQVALVGRLMSMGTLHRTYPVSGAIATAAAARIKGSVAHDVARIEPGVGAELNLGHPGGTLPVGADVELADGTWHCQRAVVYRTARRLMEGYVRIPPRVKLASPAVGARR